MNSITEMAEKRGDEDKIYDEKNSMEDIISYIKHQFRDSQQSKAKSSAFEQLDANTALWLKDYAQKVLPDKHRRPKGLLWQERDDSSYRCFSHKKDDGNNQTCLLYILSYIIVTKAWRIHCVYPNMF